MAFDPNNCLKIQNVSGDYNTISFGTTYSSKLSDLYKFSKDGINWSNPILLDSNEIAYVKGTWYPGFADNGPYHIFSDREFDVIGGNVYSLIDDGAGVPVDTSINPSPEQGFSYLFYKSKVRKITADIFPIKKVGNLTLSHVCKNCESLIEVSPSLFSTFTELGSQALFEFFEGCSKLVKAPDLPISDISKYGSLSCAHLFRFCSSLKEIRYNAKMWTVMDTDDWVNGVASTGTMYLNPQNPTIVYDNSAVPYGWTTLPYEPTPLPPPPPPENPENCFKIQILEDDTAIALPPINNQHYYFSIDGINYVPDSIVANAGDIVYVYGSAYPS